MRIKIQKSIKLIVYDFDGVMTDNKVHVTEDGKEFVTCNRADGLGVELIKTAGIEQLIISTEKNLVVSKRAKKLNIDVIQGAENKKHSLEKYCEANEFNLQEVFYVGNDINDKNAMEIVGYTICPSDAHPSIKKISDKITNARGGEGVIREIADWLCEPIPDQYK